MPPKKKSQKISLNEFLGDAALGSWADEMESLPNAPAPRIDDDRPRDRYSRKDDFSSSRSDRVHAPPREDLPLPDHAPYTAFVGNLAFDLDEMELGQFFGPSKNIKIIRDRDDKPKGFGYIEFADLEGLKTALSKSGSNLAGRTIRVSVAEPPKERSIYHDGGNDTKFDVSWRREGSFSEPQDTRESRRRFEGLPHGDRSTFLADNVDDWRSTRPVRVLDTDTSHTRKKASGFFISENNASNADKEEIWTIGSKFKPSNSDERPSGLKYGNQKGRDLRPANESTSVVEENDWRSSVRAKPASPTNSTPSTPQVSRRRLELLPRSTSASASTSPLSSPKLSSARAGVNPFGSARPVDVTSREKDVADRLEKERELLKDRCLPMSRSSSRTASERNPVSRPRSPPAHRKDSSSLPPSPKPSNSSVAATVRPTLSFANVAGTGREPVSDRGPA